MEKKLFKLKSKFKPAGDQPQAIKKLIAGAKKNYRYQTLLGVTGSGKTFSVANVIEAVNKPVLVMAPNKALAAQLYREYKNFFPENSVNYFVSYYDYYQPEAYMPTTDTYIEKEAMINQEIDRLRHEATTALSTRRDVIIVASVSCIYNLGLPIRYLESTIHLAVGQTITRGDLIRQLVKIQFGRTMGELERGKFRARGDVFEIMPASEKVIYRIYIQDQKISAIEIADLLTRKKISEMPEVVVFPPKHFVASEPEMKKAISDIKLELADRLKYFKKEKLYLEAERLERRTRYDMEMLKSIGYCHGIENYSRHLAGKLAGEAPDTLLAYFPKDKDGKPDFLTIIDESHIAVPQIRGMYAGDRARKETLVKYGWRLPSALDNRPLRFEEFEKRIGQVIFTSATPADFEARHSEQTAEQLIRPTGLIDPPVEVRPVFDQKKNYSQIDDIVKECRKIISGVIASPAYRQAGPAKQSKGIAASSLPLASGKTPRNDGIGGRVIINTLTKKQAEDLDSYLRGQGIKSDYLHSDIKTIARTDILMNFRKGRFDVLIGVNLLREGLDLPEVSLVAILDADREGFLRSEVSLMQTMGRAARNVSGKVILYADNLTGSIKNAIKEVDRRRKLQLAYNKKHGITPQTIHKIIEDFLDIPQEIKE